MRNKTKFIDTFRQIVWSRVTAAPLRVVLPAGIVRRPIGNMFTISTYHECSHAKKTFTSIRVHRQSAIRSIPTSCFSLGSQSICQELIFCALYAFVQRKQDNRSHFRPNFLLIESLETKNVCEKSAGLRGPRCIGLNMCIEIQRAELGKQVYSFICFFHSILKAKSCLRDNELLKNVTHARFQLLFSDCHLPFHSLSGESCSSFIEWFE